ncbi:MAG: hypothetical protein WCO56_07255 [Verrucomicrobiota bacterium]
MDNLKLEKTRNINRLLKACESKSSKLKVEEAFRAFAHEASQAGSDSKFLEELRTLTGHNSVDEMIARFRKLAGLDNMKKSG